MKLFLCCLFLSLSVYSQTEMSTQFCQAYFSQKNPQSPNQKKNSSAFKFLLTFMYNPKALVEIAPLDGSVIDSLNKRSTSKLFFDLIPREKMTQDEKSELKRLRKIVNQNKKQLNRKEFINSLNKLSTHEECYQFIDTPDMTNLFLKFEKDYKSYYDLKTKKFNEVTAKMMEKNLNIFRRKGWTVFTGLSINEVHRQILKAPKSTVLIVGHASEKGEVVDKDVNIIPATFFKNTEIDNLIIYSCHSDKVIDFYEIYHIKSIHRYYKPQLTEISQGMIEADKIPLIALKTILKETFNVNSSTYSAKSCSLHMNTSNNTMGVFLNKIFLGSMEKEIFFDCDFLKGNGNILEIYSMEKSRMQGSLNLSAVTLNKSEVVKLNDFISKVTNKHIVTKGTFNL